MNTSVGRVSAAGFERLEPPASGRAELVVAGEGEQLLVRPVDEDVPVSHVGREIERVAFLPVAGEVSASAV
ncbi:hypothetical protein ACFQL0_22655 [Haloplanus litoreus]|uniref:Uncharacterized protein n=1 Tax=Haloplanus litoreus TaxID=767515 RepID=A0ABD6A4P2_9EURY